MAAVADAGEIRAALHAATCQLVTHERQRVSAERQLQVAIILDHLAAVGQRAQLHLWLDPFRA